MSMTYSVLGRSHSEHPQPSLATLRNVSKTLDSALSLLPVEMDSALPPEYAYNLDHLYTLLQRLQYLVPNVADVWLVGYSWGTGGEAWTTWSGHEDRKTAERWLAAWRTSKIGQHRDWEIRRGDCKLGKFMPKGARIAAAMGVLG